MDATSRKGRVMTLLEEVRQAKTLPSPRSARLIRLAAGVSQERMAAELGVHRMTIHRWETGARTPQGPYRVAYAQLLDGLREEMAS